MNCSDRVVGRFFRPKLWPVLLLIAGIVTLVSTEYYNYVKSGQLSGVQTKNQAVELEYLQKPYLEANSDKRLKIIEKIFYPQIMKFMSDSEGNFSGEGWPLAEASCLYIVRRGRVRNRIGFDPSAFLPKDWEQH